MTMPYPSPRNNKPSNNLDEKRTSLAVRINRAARELNPFLLIVALGLLILNVTFYLGMSVSRLPAISAGIHAYSASSAAPRSEPAPHAARN